MPRLIFNLISVETVMVQGPLQPCCDTDLTDKARIFLLVDLQTLLL